MEFNTLIEGIYPIMLLVLTYMVSYLLTKTRVTKRVSGAIHEAELKYVGLRKEGENKLKFAIDLLYGYVPVYLKPFITRELVGRLVQETFDETKKYVDIQLDKVSDKINEKLDKGLGK